MNECYADELEALAALLDYAFLGEHKVMPCAPGSTVGLMLEASLGDRWAAGAARYSVSHLLRRDR